PFQGGRFLDSIWAATERLYSSGRAGPTILPLSPAGQASGGVHRRRVGHRAIVAADGGDERRHSLPSGRASALLVGPRTGCYDVAGWPDEEPTVLSSRRTRGTTTENSTRREKLRRGRVPSVRGSNSGGSNSVRLSAG